MIILKNGENLTADIGPEWRRCPVCVVSWPVVLQYVKAFAHNLASIAKPLQYTMIAKHIEKYAIIP